ncbi:hypothetical protein N9937_02390 [bacterium]|nr:hypothetical protein [bacterium]
MNRRGRPTTFKEPTEDNMDKLAFKLSPEQHDLIESVRALKTDDGEDIYVAKLKRAKRKNSLSKKKKDND